MAEILMRPDGSFEGDGTLSFQRPTLSGVAHEIQRPAVPTVSDGDTDKNLGVDGIAVRTGLETLLRSF